MRQKPLCTKKNGKKVSTNRRKQLDLQCWQFRECIRETLAMNVLYAWGQGLQDQAYGNLLSSPSSMATSQGFRSRTTGLWPGTRVDVYSHGTKLKANLAQSRCWVQEPLLPQDDQVVAADCSDSHTVAVGRSGVVYSWGTSPHGRSSSPQTRPAQINTEPHTAQPLWLLLMESPASSPAQGPCYSAGRRAAGDWIMHEASEMCPKTR